MISFLQHLDEAAARKLDIKQFPHFAKMRQFGAVLDTLNLALSRGQTTIAEHGDVKSAFNRYAGKYMSSDPSEGQLPLAVKRETMPHEVWIKLWVTFDSVFGNSSTPEIHTAQAKLKKAVAWLAANAKTAAPMVVTTMQHYIAFAQEMTIIATAVETMKSMIVKRVIKTDAEKSSEKTRAYQAPLADSSAVKAVHDTLKEMTDEMIPLMVKERVKELREKCAEVEKLAEKPKDFYTLMVATTRDERIRERRRFLGQLISIMGGTVKENWKTQRATLDVGNYLPKLKAMATTEALGVQSSFLQKNVAKLASILQKKSNIKGKPKILQMQYARGVFEGDLQITFKDGASFRVRNKIVSQTRSTANMVGYTQFYQFPTTFHDVMLPNGKAMGLPSEERMNTVFVNESRHEPLQMDVEDTSRDGNDRITFHEFLQEDKSGKLMHLTHLEDLMLDEGVAGMRRAIEVLHQFQDMLINGGVSKAMHVTTKWDGAPSVVFGPDPADGKFFVATKSAFSKAPKLMKSHADITDTYGSEGVAQVLHDCLSELALLHPTRVLQGDLLFSGGRGVKSQSIDGTDYLTFRPNTILYAVGATSALGGHISRAALGIVIHTMYAGAGTLEHLRATPITPGVFSALKKTNRVVALDAAYDDVSGNATFTTDEDAEFSLLLSRIGTLAQHISALVYTTLMTEPLHALVNMFLNQQVRGGHTTSPKQTLDALSLFLSERQEKEMAARSSAAGKEKVAASFGVMMDSVRTHQREFGQWFELHTAITNAKVMLIRKLAQASRVQTFIPTADGFRVTGPEGFVAVSHAGKMVKLVDRLEFSRANFLAPKEWQ